MHIHHLQNNRYKQHGFDVMTEEDKVFYPLAADSEAEMEEWISILNRAIGLEVEETDKAGVSLCVCEHIFSPYTCTYIQVHLAIIFTSHIHSHRC